MMSRVFGPPTSQATQGTGINEAQVNWAVNVEKNSVVLTAYSEGILIL